MLHSKPDAYQELLAIPPGYLNIMGYVDESEVNDPGCRAVLWVQGCLRECPGCFNPEFQDRLTWASDQLEVHILKNGDRSVIEYPGQMSLN